MVKLPILFFLDVSLKLRTHDSCKGPRAAQCTSSMFPECMSSWSAGGRLRLLELDLNSGLAWDGTASTILALHGSAICSSLLAQTRRNM